MQTMVPLYGFGGGSGGTGAALTVTAPAGATVTVSKDGKSKTKVADLDGVAVFKGLSSGDWLLSITDGTQTAQKTVTITADYTTAITFFAATIHVTYPAGSTCTATDGTTTLTAPNTSGTWDCVVPNAGTWTVSLDSGFCESAEITQNGEKKTIDKWYLYRRGNEYATLTGGFSSENYIAPGYTATEAVRNEDSVFLSGGSNSVSVFGTKNKVDITGFSKIRVVCTVTSTKTYDSKSYGLKFILNNVKSVNSTIELFNFDSKKSYDQLIAPPETGGEYYIAMVSYSGSDCAGYLYEINLEV